MSKRILIALIVAAWSVLCAAQSPVYESHGKDGPVFSDEPSPGAKRIDLGPGNVMQTPQQPQAPAATTAPAYTSLSITSPANQGTVHTNTGAFDVHVAVQPALRTAAGDVIRVQFDSTLLPETYDSAQIQLTQADWSGAAQGDDAEHTLQVMVVSSTGQVLIKSAPVSFYAHRAAREEGRGHRR
jgi:hypothetical protein